MEHNVLVVGMPNVGKSTLLNALRNMGIKGRKLSAFQPAQFAYAHVTLILSYS
jgi:ribosome biogenesis GTPase A